MLVSSNSRIQGGRKLIQLAAHGGVDNQGAADAGEGDLAEGDHEGANYSGGLLKSFASSGRFGAIPAATLMGAFKVL